MTLSQRAAEALRILRETGYLERQEDGYWDTEPHQPRISFGERTILTLIRENHAKVVAEGTTTGRFGRRGLPTKIAPAGDDE